MRVLGVDVSVARAMDAVLLDEDGRIVHTARRQTPAEIRGLLVRWEPDAVAIDAPPTPAHDRPMRAGERELAHLGIHMFSTPCDPAVLSRPFYGWMRVGFQVFDEADKAGYPRFLGTGSVYRRAFEAFPHATAVALTGTLPPPGWARRQSGKRAWRESSLRRQGIDPSPLSSLDQVDAALCAVTGLWALTGRAAFFGTPGEDALAVPDPKSDRLAHVRRAAQ